MRRRDRLGFCPSSSDHYGRKREPEERSCGEPINRDGELDGMTIVEAPNDYTCVVHALKDLSAAMRKETQMRFLVHTSSKHPIPLEMVPPLIDAMTAFANKYTENGKLEDVWSYAGLAGGGGIANVDSLEELDAIMLEFPFRPFSEVEVLPLVDLQGSLQRQKVAFQAMMGSAGGGG